MTNKITNNQLNLLKPEANSLKLYVINYVQDGYEAEDRQSFMNDVMNHGCVSGIVSDLIYTYDTVEMHNQYETEIWELASRFAEENDMSTLEFINTLDHSIDNLDLMKNALAWFAFEQMIIEINEEIKAQIKA